MEYREMQLDRMMDQLIEEAQRVEDAGSVGAALAHAWDTFFVAPLRGVVNSISPRERNTSLSPRARNASLSPRARNGVEARAKPSPRSSPRDKSPPLSGTIYHF